MELIRYEAARSALAECRAVDEVKDLRDKALAMSAYARQAKDTELMQMAAEIKVRAERRLGEMLREQKETVGLQSGARGFGKKVEFQEGTPLPPTLAEVGIDKKLSMRSQQLANIPEEHFEATISATRETASTVTTTLMLRLAEEQRKTEETRQWLEQLKRDNAWRRAIKAASEMIRWMEYSMKENTELHDDQRQELEGKVARIETIMRKVRNLERSIKC